MDELCGRELNETMKLWSFIVMKRSLKEWVSIEKLEKYGETMKWIPDLNSYDVQLKDLWISMMHSFKSFVAQLEQRTALLESLKSENA
jgi:hypothetical protein